MTKSLADKAMVELSNCLSDAEILAMNCMSPLAVQGCFDFELCGACERKKHCLCFMAKKFLEHYKEKGVLCK